MTQHKNKTEKRIHPRVSKTLPIKIKHEDFDIVTETKNVSCTGAYCQVDRYVPPFTKVKTTILISDDKDKIKNIHCKGVVVRVERIEDSFEPHYNIAIFFNDISKTNMSRMSRFVKEHHSQG